MILYDIAFIIFSIFYIPFSIYKKGLRGFNIKARMGFIASDTRAELTSSKNIWIHAVSVGEAMVLGEFMEGLKNQFPDHRIVISTTTEAGNNVAKKLLNGGATVIYSPLDLSFAVGKFFRAIKPSVLIIAETELWPNLISISKRYNIPVIVINGRISPRSFGRYKIVKYFLRPMLAEIDLFCMQSDDDAARIISIGAPAERVKVTGNMKFDMGTKPSSFQLPVSREKLGLIEKDVLLVAGSTHKGEEGILLDVYKDLSKEFKNVKLLIAPRHINRIPQVERLVIDKGFAAVKISDVFSVHRPPPAGGRLATLACREIWPGQAGKQLFLLDTIGHLKEFYSIADIVFVGGSLIKHGGQNPIEPAYFSKPIIFGPFMFNFRRTSRILLEAKGAVEVKGPAELKDAIASLINEPQKARAMGDWAKKAIEANRGASGKNVELIKGFLS